MSKEFNLQIDEAKKLYVSKDYDESLELFEELYRNNPDSFKHSDLISYCWAIYQVHVKSSDDADELAEACGQITDLIPQSDLNYRTTCPYTFAVFRLLDYFNSQNEYYNIFEWIDKINPKLLDDDTVAFNGRTYKSRKQKYYDYLSKASLECAEWEMCVEVSKEALTSLNHFVNHADTWYSWRIAKSLRQLKQHRLALDYLREVLEVKKEWYVYREIAENYCILGKNEEALNCICRAVLTSDPINVKVNMFHLAYTLLKDINPEIAKKHAELYVLLKLEGNGEISADVEDLDVEGLKTDDVFDEIRQYWVEFRFKNQELQHGNVSRYVEDKGYGFIKSGDTSVFFHRSDFYGDEIYEGIEVSFYTEKSYDKSKNRESLKAVNIRCD